MKTLYFIFRRTVSQQQAAWRARGLCVLASLLVTACANLQSGDAQTIFVPAGDGSVQAQLVHTGPARTNECPPPANDQSGTPFEGGDVGEDSISDRERLLCSTAELRYLGRRTAAVFIKDQSTRISRFGSALFPDSNPEAGFCALWRRRFASQYPGGDFSSCSEFRYAAKVLRKLVAESDISLTTVEFERRFPIGSPEDVRIEHAALLDNVGVLYHWVIVTKPVCGYVVYHEFQDAGGKLYNVLEGTDPGKYGRVVPVGFLTNPVLSKNSLGRTYGNADTVTACAEQLKREVRR